MATARGMQRLSLSQHIGRLARSSTLPNVLRSSLQQSCLRQQATGVRYASQKWPMMPRRPGPQYQRFNRPQQIYQLWYTRPVFRYGIIAVVGGSGVFYVANLETVPVTGRRRFNIISPENEKQLGVNTVRQITQQYQGSLLPPSHPYSRMVARVMNRLIPVSGLADEKWEVHVINDKEQKNAFVLPGGKVFVFSGIIPICQDDDGLAAVLAHEISHNVAHHTSEKLSQRLWVVIGAVGLTSVLDVSGQIANTLLDLVLSLPNSRTQEAEADHIGLLMMSQACYNPEAAVGLWQRMAKAEQYAPPQFLSTHPRSLARAKAIEKLMPEAQQKRVESECGLTSQYVEPFQQRFQPQAQRRPSAGPTIGSRPASQDDDDFW